MFNKKSVLSLLIALVFVVLSAGCGRDSGSSEADASSESASSDSAAVSQQSVWPEGEYTLSAPENTELPEGVPEPVSAEYNGKKITLSCVGVSDINSDNGYGTTEYFFNGAVVVVSGNLTDSNGREMTGYNALDIYGRRIFEKNYAYISDFNDKGVAVAAREPVYDTGLYKDFVFVNINGEELGEATEEDLKKQNELCSDSPNSLESDYWDSSFLEELDKKYLADNADGILEMYEQEYYILDENGNKVKTFPAGMYFRLFCVSDKVICAETAERWKYYLYDYSGNLLYDEPFSYVSGEYEDMMLFRKDGKVGIMSDDGKIIIPETFEDLEVVKIMQDKEGYFLGQFNGCYSVLKLTVE